MAARQDELGRQYVESVGAGRVRARARDAPSAAVVLPSADGPEIGAASFAGSRAGLEALGPLLQRAAGAALTQRRSGGPLPAGTMADVLGGAADALGPAHLAEEGIGDDAALALLAGAYFKYGLDLTHPRTAAHLQPPPLSVAVVADALVGASNASLDTYDSGPSAIAIERWVIDVLGRLARLGAAADGVLTPGGSLSNLLGLLLARDALALRRGLDVRRDGMTGLNRLVVFCSELAHFSVHRACAALGLGEAAVHDIPTDERRRMRPEALAAALGALDSDQIPLAVVATAGTTDFGSIDPLPDVADIAEAHGIWLHVDAAYGFGALFSDQLAGRLAGIERASSVTLDLHKLGWQPAPASVLLVRDAAAFAALDREVAYLNPSDDVAAGLDGLLGRSLQTTRRADAVKIAASFLAHGRRNLGRMVDACHALACHAQERVEMNPQLELVAGAELTTVVFRYRAGGANSSTLGGGAARGPFADLVNAEIRRCLLQSGRALIGRTSARLVNMQTETDRQPRVCLKLTLLNPLTTPGDLAELLEDVVAVGRDVERRLRERAS
jgi:L-2,4-diaminobutyrate decarboxylase